MLRKGLLAYLTAANARLLCTSPLLPPAPRGTSRDTPPPTSAPEVAAAAGGARRFSVYLLYWYNSTNTEVAGRFSVYLLYWYNSTNTDAAEARQLPLPPANASSGHCERRAAAEVRRLLALLVQKWSEVSRLLALLLV